MSIGVLIFLIHQLPYIIGLLIDYYNSIITPTFK